MSVQESGMRKSDRLIPWYFVLFFLVIAAVDGTFVTLAVRTMPGETVAHPYEEGLAYNSVLARAAEQKQLGWQGGLEIKDGKNIVFNFSDKNGEPLSGASVQAHITRATAQGHDFDLPLQEAQPGVYAAEGHFPLPGLWDINVEATWHSHPYYMKKSLTAP